LSDLAFLAVSIRASDIAIFGSQTLVTATPLTLAALGGVMSERSGVVNIALEGMMLTGAFAGYVVALFTHSLWLGLIAAVLAGMLIASIHAILAISFVVDQIVSGTVINILAIGITGVFYRTYLESQSVAGPGHLETWHVPVLGDLPIVGQILFQNAFVTYLMLALVVVVYLVIFHTTWGLRTRACGEHPQAADTAGINVYFVRYVNVIISGGLAGLGGAYFSLQQLGNFLPGMTGGRGFIGLAAMIFGRWNPFGAFGASLLFTASDQVASRAIAFGVHVPGQFLGMLPYVLTIVVVAGAVGRAVAPAADGKPYRKS
jgi:general nucleoside transport system permease protein